MVRNLVGLIVSLILCLWFVPASADDAPAAAFLKGIIAREFDGDIMARRGQVIYTDGKEPVVGSCDCWVERESWTLSEELAVVSAWNIVNVKDVSTRKKTVTVRYHVLATAVEPPSDSSIIGRFRQIRVFEKPHDETVRYTVLSRNGQWKIADPPLPRVSIEPVTAELKRNLAIETELRDKALKENDEKAVKYREFFIFSTQSQLSLLEFVRLRK